MFRNIAIYRCNDARPTDEGAAGNQFLPCAPSGERSLGYVGLHTIRVERKAVPNEVLKRRVEAMAKQVEQETGRKPGRKARADLKAEALLELLPKAFPKRKDVPILWLDDLSILVVGSTTTADTDDIAALLCATVPGLTLSVVGTEQSPASLMRDMLLDHEHAYPVQPGRSTVLAGDAGMAIRYKNYPLDSENVRAHVTAGRAVQSLEMFWDERMSWTLTDTLQFKSCELLNVISEDDATEDVVEAERALWRGTLTEVLGFMLDEVLA